MELRDAPDIHACTVLPASIDTPLFQHAANFSGRQIKPMDLVYPPEQVADTIIRLTKHPRRELIVGAAGRMAAIGRLLSGALSERPMARRVERKHLKPEPGEASHGNLFTPMDDHHRISGGWPHKPFRRRRLAGSLALLAAPAAIASLRWHRRPLTAVAR